MEILPCLKFKPATPRLQKKPNALHIELLCPVDSMSEIIAKMEILPRLRFKPVNQVRSDGNSMSVWTS